MIDLVDKNFNLHSRKIPAATMGMKVYEFPGMSYVDAGLSCDTFNIIHIYDGSRIAVEDIVTAIGYYREKELAYCLWVCKENLPENVKAVVDLLQLKQQNAEPGMLLKMDDYELTQGMHHTNTAIGNDKKLIRDYAEVVAKNWAPPDLNVLEYYNNAALAILSNKATIQFAVYYHDKKPVSVIELFSTDDKTIGLYGLATLEAYRGKGIGSSLLRFALNTCKALGYSNVVLQASEDGLGIYNKMGFKIYTEYYEFA